MNQKRIGSDFDDFLREEGTLETTEAAAIKRAIAYQVEQEMKQRGISKKEMASRMKTSRAAVDRLLDPANTSVTLTTLGRAAAALGRQLSVEFTKPATRGVRNQTTKLDAPEPRQRRRTTKPPAAKRTRS